MNTLIEIHALQNFAPSNLNRDDSGAPKDAFFGGTRRARISSQCSKHAVRGYFKQLVKNGTLNGDDLAQRTKRILDLLVDDLVKRGRDQAAANKKVRRAFQAVKVSIDDDGKTQYLMFPGLREIARLAEVIHDQWDMIEVGAGNAEEGKKGKKSKKEAAKDSSPQLKEAIEKVLDGGRALDIALFGRMLADMPEKNQDAACQVAHAISTHSVEREFDYYTAVDDLKPDDQPGADMIGTVEFNSACYYRYSVVDWEKLTQNLQGDAELAKRGLRAFLEGFAVAEPTGKQNSFAAHNPPEFIAISVRHNTAPRNLANAFEVPIRISKGESLTKDSVGMLVSEAGKLERAYGGDGKTFVLDLTDSKLDGFGERVSSLEDLLNKTVLQIKE